MSTKRWIVIFSVAAVVLLLAVLLPALFYTERHEVGIYQDGHLLFEIDLTDGDGRYVVTYEGRENVILVEDGEIYVVSAECPDQVCVKHGVLSGAEPIVCLPNRLVIRWLNSSSSAFDVVSG